MFIFSLYVCSATYSPPLDKYGNSVRGTVLFKRLADRIPTLHIFESSRHEILSLPLPAHRPLAMISAASAGDLDGMNKLLEIDAKLCNAADYDGRSALHLAVCESQLEVITVLILLCFIINDNQNIFTNNKSKAVELLLNAGANAHARDRWGNSPKNEASQIVRK